MLAVATAISYFPSQHNMGLLSLALPKIAGTNPNSHMAAAEDYCERRQKEEISGRFLATSLSALNTEEAILALLHHRTESYLGSGCKSHNFL